MMTRWVWSLWNHHTSIITLFIWVWIQKTSFCSRSRRLCAVSVVVFECMKTARDLRVTRHRHVISNIHARYVIGRARWNDAHLKRKRQISGFYLHKDIFCVDTNLKVLCTKCYFFHPVEYSHHFCTRKNSSWHHSGACCHNGRHLKIKVKNIFHNMYLNGFGIVW